jgi:branched-chain amino acid transport system substrate-binding protein
MSRVTKLFPAACAIAALAAAVPAAAQGCKVTVGRVVPITGPLLDMGRETPWLDENKIKPINAAGGLEVGGKRCRIEYKIYDSKGTMAGSGEAANRAILQDKVDVVFAQGTPDTTNAPSDLCERYQVPCITSNTPIEPWLFGPDGKPKEYKYSFHFFFAVPDLVKNHVGMIKALPGGFNGNIGYLYPNDPDGTVFASLFDPAFKAEGWKPTDPGRFQQGLPDFSAIINQFKRNRVEVVTGVLAPPDLQNYLQQAAQAGYKPRMYIIDKGTGYPEAVKALGSNGIDILSVNFWSPAYPGKSKYGGYTGQGLVDLYEKQNAGKYYSPPLAYTDASYDVLFDALQRAGSTDRAKLVEALKMTDLDTVVGQVKFNAQHYSVQPLGGAQWRVDDKTKRWVKDNVYNAVYPTVKKTAEMRLYQAK